MNETVVGEKGMVVAPHRAAAEAGAEVLRAGGNAVEAMIAAAATIAVVYPHMNAIGGDNFLLIAEPGRPPLAIDACGTAGSLATRDRYGKKGYDAVPVRGADAALTVAGAVSGWALASEVAAAMGGRLSRRDLLADAIGHAKEGVPVSRSLAETAKEELAAIKDAPGFAAHFLVDGKAPEFGALLRQQRLADTLEHLTHAGFADFYRGDIAAEIAADLEAVGSPITRGDLKKHEARIVKPLSVELSDATVFNTPPPTQGLASLIILGLFDRLGVERGESFEHVHGLIEASKRAYVVRDAEVTDPVDVGDIVRFLDPAWLAAEAETIDMRHASPWPQPNRKGDTVWLGAIDASGLMVSLIQSIYHAFGSGVVLPRTGILWQNRGISFSLDPASRNPLMPGRKPFHTLNPPLARFSDGRVMTYGSMGGDGQPLFQAEIFTRIARFAMEPGEALDAPRWVIGRSRGFSADVVAEDRFDPDLVAALVRAGHEVSLLDRGYSDSMGHAGVIIRRPNGRFLGASDPRSDGAAVAV